MNIYDDEKVYHPEIDAYDAKTLAETDGHFCFDWDGLAVSAWTQEYDCCTDYPKSRLGWLINRYAVWRFNMGWWWTVGLPDLIHGRKNHLTGF